MRSSPRSAIGATRSRARKNGCSWVPRLRRIKDRTERDRALIKLCELRPLHHKGVSERVDQSASEGWTRDARHRLDVNYFDPKYPRDDRERNGDSSPRRHYGLNVIAADYVEREP